MKIISMVVSAMSFVVTAVVTLLVVRALRSDLTFLHLALGAIVCTQMGVILHHRSPGASWKAGTKMQLGVVTAVTCVVFELIVQADDILFAFKEKDSILGAPSNGN
jgi:hypothetical protein